MIDLDPCLVGCDSALAEAERLLAILSAMGGDEAALVPVRDSITRLRREVDRLRGLNVAPAQPKTAPFWIEMGGGESPWSTGAASLRDQP